MLLTAGLLCAQDYSHARVVRLSFVEGTVTVQRPDVPDWAEAPVNTPIQEGFKLSTAEKSFAEVEFENGSTIRLGQLSLLEFSQLALLPSGGKINRLALQQGYATFHALPEGEDIYELNTPWGQLTPRGKALFRVDLDENLERLEVFKGSVDVASNLGSWSLAKNDVLELRPGSGEPYSLTQGITQDAWDEWVNERENRVQMAPSGGAPSPRLYSNDVSDLLYGWNDLSNYGMWSYLQGWGYGWVPTVGAGWAPFSLGRWCWYPGFGWVWISSEPWGWLPFHYGGWEYIAGFGWVWFPDSFGYFSPALVTWYSGPGWVGWVPRGSPRGRHGSTSPCPAGQACGTVVSVTTFQNGSVVTPTNRLPVDPIRGRRIEPPGIPPTRTAMLPGRAVSENPGAVRGAVAGGEPGARLNRHASPAPDSTVVFDPVQGRYVNSPTAGGTARPAQPSSEVSSSPGQEAPKPGGAGGPRPATAPGAPPKKSAPGGTAPGHVSPAVPAEPSKPHSMGPLPDPAPAGRELAGAAPAPRLRDDARVHQQTDAGSERNGEVGASRPIQSGASGFEGAGKSAGAPMDRGAGGRSSSGSSAHPH
jgi:hypothetical protein